MCFLMLQHTLDISSSHLSISSSSSNTSIKRKLLQKPHSTLRQIIFNDFIARLNTSPLTTTANTLSNDEPLYLQIYIIIYRTAITGSSRTY
jgi:hypothetical protein